MAQMSLGILSRLNGLTSSQAPSAGEKRQERPAASAKPQGYTQDSLQRTSPVGGAAGGTYLVRPGDSLARVARERLGDTGRWKEIYELNRGTIGRDPHIIQPGTTLRLPVIARVSEKPVLRPTSQANERFLTFAEQLQRDPSKIWNTSLTPRTEAAIQSYRMGALGRSVQSLNLTNKALAEVRQDLLRRGFKLEQSVIRDVRTGKPVINPETRQELPMEIWIHPDGGMVRIKPEGDPTNRFRPQPHLSVSVLYPPGASGHNFNNEAFKVDASGNPLPKWAADASNPFGAETPAGKKWLDDLASRTHINLP